MHGLDIRKTIRGLIWMALCTAFALQGAIGMNVSAWVVHDGNTFHNYEQIRDVIIQPNFQIHNTHAWSSGMVRAYYDGAFLQFQEMDARHYQLHYGGFALSQKLSQGRALFAFGGKFGYRINGEDYAYYNYQHAQGHGHFRRFFGRRGVLHAGIHIKQRRYASIPQFDYRELECVAQQNLFLPTRTTLIGRLQIGRKRYLEARGSETEIHEIVPRNDIGASIAGQASGRAGDPGQGRGNEKGGGKSNPRTGDPAVDPENQAIERTVRVELPGNEVMLRIASLRIAQSLGRFTGLAAEMRFQRHLNGEGRALNYQDFGYEDDDPLFDDPYNYESNAWFVELTQKLPFKLVCKLGGEAQRKIYPYPACDLEGKLTADEPRRRDDRTKIHILFSRRFSGPGMIQSIEAAFGLAAMWNRSNDLYFDYQSELIHFGWQMTL